ncbi:MAG: enolase C-terminal domain-like protein, partial [Thermomicrobiales bacterium]
PDVKHCGGMGALRSIGELAAVRGISVAPHNPSGPVSTIVSGHALAGLATFRSLEIAFGEVPWRADVVNGAEQIKSGRLVLPISPGHGIDSIHDPTTNDSGRNG